MKGKSAKIVFSALLLVIAGVLLVNALSGDSVVPDSKTRTAIDSVTGQTYKIRLVEGSRFPWKNPDTGENTLYPAEQCYWTKDGKAKLEPTLVFVKSYAGSKEKTICPDCGREVRPHNPLPPDNLMVEAAEQKSKGK